MVEFDLPLKFPGAGPKAELLCNMVSPVVEIAGAVIVVQFEAKLGGRPPSSFAVPIVPNGEVEFVAVEFKRGIGDWDPLFGQSLAAIVHAPIEVVAQGPLRPLPVIVPQRQF